MKISAIIPTFNEEENIFEAIKSVSWADEIIVVDSYSTDKTIEIAKKLDVKIIQREYQYSASQKNWAIPKAKHNWIFLLDADERVSNSLKEEILNWKKTNPNYQSYWINRTNHFMGKKIRYSGWQGDKVIRLFHRDCRYEDKKVHAEIKISSKVGKLKSPILHYTFRSMSHYLLKWDQYSSWSAKDHLKNVNNPNYFHFFIKPTFRFLRDFIFRGGILDGKTGYIICKLSSIGVFMRYVKLKELKDKSATK